MTKLFGCKKFRTLLCERECNNNFTTLKLIYCFFYVSACQSRAWYMQKNEQKPRTLVTIPIANTDNAIMQHRDLHYGTLWRNGYYVLPIQKGRSLRPDECLTIGTRISISLSSSTILVLFHCSLLRSSVYR